MTKLKSIRERSGMKQDEAAAAVGISLGVWRHYEQGSRSFDGAGLKTIFTAALVLHCNISDLIENEDTSEALQRYLDRGEL